jgi:hypothetical protein
MDSSLEKWRARAKELDSFSEKGVRQILQGNTFYFERMNDKKKNAEDGSHGEADK